MQMSYKMWPASVRPVAATALILGVFVLGAPGLVTSGAAKLLLVLACALYLLVICKVLV